MRDIMLDIETLSTDSNAVIISIAAVQFDLKTGEIGEQFMMGLDISEQIRKDGVVDGDTILWWLKQSDEARQSVTSLTQHGVGKVLTAFNSWIKQLGITPASTNLWGNSNSFDCTIVRNLYRREGITFILPFWCDKDVRTLVILKGVDTRRYEFTGVSHNPIDDCLHQIKYCTT